MSMKLNVINTVAHFVQRSARTKLATYTLIVSRCKRTLADTTHGQPRGGQSASTGKRYVGVGDNMAFTNKKGKSSVLKHVKYQQQRQGRVQPPGVIDMQVIGTGHPGTPRSVIIHMDHFKYLFNCGEGTQRISMEHRMKISKVQEIFMTSHSWDNVGGLLGMCLSLESMDVPTIGIHGPPNVEKLVTMSKGFAQLHRIRVQKNELEEGFFVDSAMRIDYIKLLPSLSEQEPVASDSTQQAIAVAYLCQPHAKDRNVSFEKCVDLGIPRGPMIGELKRGLEVTLPNGNLIKPDDILGDPEPNDPFLVLECPGVEYIQSLHSSELIQRSSLGLVVHMSPQTVIDHPEYQQWLQSLPHHSTHIVLNDQCSGLVYEGVYRIQAMLNMIHADIFPLLPGSCVPSPEVEVPTSEGCQNITKGEANLKYNIRSKNRSVLNRDLCIKLDDDAFRQMAHDQENFSEALTQVKKDLDQLDRSKELSKYPEILFLGTGSAIPNKVRNVSAIWLNLSEDQAMLLDCGENTYGQLVRHYGEDTEAMLLKLSAVFVSHLHADHHLGIITVVRERRRVLERRGMDVTPLLIIAPPHLAEWYQAIDNLELESASSTKVVAVEYFYKNTPEAYSDQDVYNHVLEQLNMSQIEMVRVIHRQFPHGVVLTHRSGWKLAYSGDTLPCNNLVEAGRNCDVLIHEATMEDDLEEEAKMKRHSTTSQAIQVGLDMAAKFILLTHFSQRYAKIPLFNKNFSSRVGIAFDNMRVSLNELYLIPHFLPALKAMFADEYADMEERMLKRSFRKQVDNDGHASKRTKHSSCPETDDNMSTKS